LGFSAYSLQIGDLGIPAACYFSLVLLNPRICFSASLIEAKDIDSHSIWQSLRVTGKCTFNCSSVCVRGWRSRDRKRYGVLAK